MKFKALNPYRAGAGVAPLYLAGRDEILENINEMFDAMQMKIPVQSMIFSGLRGVGKTVLLNELEKLAKSKGIFCRHIEIEERKDFISQIANCCTAYLRANNKLQAVQDIARNAMDAIKALIVSFDPANQTFSLSVQEKEYYLSTNLAQSLTDVFIEVGTMAMECSVPICFFIDEIQCMREEELGALITAVHRSNQLGYPIVLIGAGLPKIYKMLSEEKSYSERLFAYYTIDSLNDEQSRKAIEKPAEMLQYTYTEEAVQKIIDITKGYPYFIQLLCKIIIDNTETKQIGIFDVNKTIPDFYTEVDNGFFKVRYERCSPMEKKFVFAMADCGELPCTISNVAENIGKSVKAISPMRGQLIAKGIIYPVRHKEIDFTVPEFDGFVKRLAEYQAYLTEKKQSL